MQVKIAGGFRENQEKYLPEKQNLQKILQRILNMGINF